MNLTSDTYFSLEAQAAYMGASQFKAFRVCEESALARLRGEWEEPRSSSLLVGSYVDAHFEGTLDRFKEQNPEIFTKQGSLKAEYRRADLVIARIERDPMLMRYLSGEKQVIKTGEIAGIPFKIKMDSYHPGKAIVDLKVMKDFRNIWDPEERRYVPFVEYWGYDFQGAIYQEIECQESGHRLPFFIAAATKEESPDIALLHIPQERLDGCLAIVREMAPVYQAIKEGREEPTRCNHCNYCKDSKVLTQIIDYTLAGYAG